MTTLNIKAEQKGQEVWGGCGDGGEMNWEIRVDIYTLICIK